MAVHNASIRPFPPPTDDQAAALRATCDYLNQAGTHVASVLLGCPPLDAETAILAELSNSMLRGAALCAGLLELTEEQRRP